MYRPVGNWQLAIFFFFFTKSIFVFVSLVCFSITIRNRRFSAHRRCRSTDSQAKKMQTHDRKIKIKIKTFCLDYFDVSMNDVFRMTIIQCSSQLCNILIQCKFCVIIIFCSNILFFFGFSYFSRSRFWKCSTLLYLLF